MQVTPGGASWRHALARPPRSSHFVQVYGSNDFLANAVAHFTCEGLVAGEAVLLYGTREHLAAITSRLRSTGLRLEDALQNGRLSLHDVHQALPLIAPHGSVDPVRYNALADPVLERLSSDPRFSGVRWWGEMASTLYHRGNREAALAAEECGDALNRKHGAILFCSFLCDSLDSHSYEAMLHDMCRTHSELIPVDDYAAHRLAVNRAIAEIVGDIDGALLQSLWSWKGPRCGLPSSQALLFWLQRTLPEKFPAVLARVRAYQAQTVEQSRVHIH
jgi:hypothetical protein